MDVELVRPTLSPDELPGVDGIDMGQAPGTRVGLTWMGELDPLVVWRGAHEVGTPVAARHTAVLGGVWLSGRTLSVRGAFPVLWQLGDGQTPLDADGVGVGDARLGMRWVPPHGERGGMGLSADLFLPTGTDNAWAGERVPRLLAQALVGVEVAGISGRLNLGVLLRDPVETALDYTATQEGQLGVGVRVPVWPDRYELTASWYARNRLDALVFAAAERVSEASIGSRVHLTPALTLDLSVGKGLYHGVGGTEARGLLALAWERHPPTPPAEPLEPDLRVVRDDPPDLTVIPIPAEPAWEEGELARIVEEKDQIEIRDPIQFEFGTAVLLPESQPTLEAVAAILHEHPELARVVIEGHASEEGSYAYNYDLALRRAAAVFQALVLRGVHPYRLSIRSMGEVVPAAPGADEVTLAKSRRVLFHIVHREIPDSLPADPAGIPQPWDGAPAPQEAP